MRMKVDTYRWNDERLVDELRERFWEKASPELKADLGMPIALTCRSSTRAARPTCV